MIDWLRQAALAPEVEIAGRTVPVAIRRNARARRLTLRLAPDGSEVRVTLPGWCASREALAFVHARTGWLAEQLGKVPQRRAPEPGGSVLYRGRELAIDWRERGRRTPGLEDDRIVVGGPAANLAPRLQRWLEREAARLMESDVAFFSARAGIPAPALRLSRAQRRWGSCSTSGIVRINWRLVQAPDAVRRSVVAHEIAHCLHFDHSPAFHAALDRLFDGDVAEADAWIKAHGRTLYAAFG
ncbi:M48 family metallopeptidase [Tsuneonella sp. YG55]|uniref:M48 family metallopeptidase n=1 Tax=Tsuneonella litorea TaxID=2976475 RepID=A0A9X2W031_9SPHN|nr:SprT family zinc-dependent metalloprotease [Tsuneonella litorea]MCT2557410.1 M48 family metallopeptidase [Tsuneonella litorea]